MDWSGVDYLWIIVMFLSAVWTLILTAPIHCRASIDETLMQWHTSPNLMKKQTHLHLGWPEGEHIFIKKTFFTHLTLTELSTIRLLKLSDARERMQVYRSCAFFLQKHNPLWVIVLEGQRFMCKYLGVQIEQVWKSERKSGELWQRRRQQGETIRGKRGSREDK